MIGEMIQEYLVGLGVQIDKPGFHQAETTINQLGSTVEKVTTGMAANFVKAGSIITVALAGATASAAGLMKHAANTDMQMQKMSRSMMISSDAAWRLKNATDALGESINDIAMNPELLGRFRELIADGGKLQVGGDFKQTMQGFRDLMFQFTRLKQEVSYAMTWVGYYLMKYLQRPLAEIQAKFKSFNDTFVRNIAVWTEKIARGIVYVVNIGRHFITFIADVGKHIKDMWDAFPKGIKIATAALAAFMLVWKMTPLNKAITAISVLLTLIDDYYGYHEGKQAAFGEMWDKLDVALEKAAALYDRIAAAAKEIYRAVVDFIREISASKEWQDFTAAMVELKDALFEIGSAIVNIIITALREMFGQFSKQDIIKGFTEVVKASTEALAGIYNAISATVKVMARLLRQMQNNKTFQEFWRGIGNAVKTVGGIIKNVILDNVKFIGKLGRAVAKLARGDFKGAAAEITGGDKPANGDPAHGGGGGGFESGTGDNEWNAQVVYQRFKAAGYNDDAIAGIMGRVQQEHNFDTSDVAEHWAEGENGEQLWVGGYGMFQWNGGRTEAFLQWAKDNNLNPQDPGVQADYAIIEARQRGLGPDRINSLGVSGAATTWTDEWEVGVHGYEQEYAQNWRDRISSGFGNMVPDPVLMRGAQSPQLAAASFMGSGGNAYRIDVGGITVNGSNASPTEIGRAVGDQLMDKLQGRAWFIQKNAATTSVLV